MSWPIYKIDFGATCCMCSRVEVITVPFKPIASTVQVFAARCYGCYTIFVYKCCLWVSNYGLSGILHLRTEPLPLVSHENMIKLLFSFTSRFTALRKCASFGRTKDVRMFYQTHQNCSSYWSVVSIISSRISNRELETFNVWFIRLIYFKNICW